MSEMIERVARAICRLGHDEYLSKDPDYIIPAAARTDGKPIATWRLFEGQARAAIEAMREPTRAMIEAVENDTVIQSGLDDCNRHGIPFDAWDLMIDAALYTAPKGS